MSREIEQLGQKKAAIAQLEGIMSGKMAPTIKMVKQQVTSLRNELQNMSASAPGYAAKFKAFEQASNKLKEMEGNMKGVKKSMDSAAGSSFFSKIKEGFLGGLGIGGGIAMFQQAVGFVRNFIADAKKMAFEMEGVENAFNRLNRPDLLDNLRTATKGTVSDLNLMKRAVQADQLGISLDKLPEMLDFARRRAKDTGQEVDYLVDSIVLGLGRKSVLILDNLGISSVELQKEFAKTGDYAQAAFNVIQRGATASGKDIDTLYEKQQRLNAIIANNQAKVGEGINFISGLFQSVLADLVSEGDYALTKEFIKNAKEAGKIKKEELAINAAANNIYEQNFKKLTDNIVAADKDGRDRIRKQATETRDRLLNGAKLQYGAESKEYERLQQSIQKAYDKTLQFMTENPLKLETISTKQLSQLTKEDLETLKQQGETAMGSMTVDDPKRGITLEKIAAIDKLLAKFQNVKGGEKAEASLAKHQAALLREFEDLQAEVATITQNETEKLTAEQEKQLTAVTNKYLALAEKAKEYKITLAGLTGLQEQEITALQEKFAKERAEQEYSLQMKNLGEYHAREKQALLQRLADKEITEQEYFTLSLEMEADHLNERLTVANDYAADAEQAEKDAQALRTQALQEGVDERNRLEKQGYRDRMAALELNVLTSRKGSKDELNARKAVLQEQFEQETAHMDKTSAEFLLKQEQHNQSVADMDRQHLMDKVQMYMDAFQQLYQAFGDFMRLQQQASEAALKKELYRIDKEKTHYDKLLEEKKISQEVYNEKTAELEEQKRAKEQEHAKKAFEQEKKAKIIAIQMSAAQAIMGVWAQNPNPIYGGIMTAVIAGIAVAQSGIVANQEFPEYAKGGLLEGAGHSEGGIAMIDSRTGRKVGEAEGGEPVLSRATYANNRELVDQLLYSSMHQGGRRLPDWMFSRPAPIRSDAYAPARTFMRDGGMVGGPLNPRGGDLSTGNGIDMASLDKFVRAVERFDEITKNGIKAKVYNNEVQDMNDELNRIKGRSRMAG